MDSPKGSARALRMDSKKVCQMVPPREWWRARRWEQKTVQELADPKEQHLDSLLDLRWDSAMGQNLEHWTGQQLVGPKGQH